MVSNPVGEWGEGSLDQYLSRSMPFEGSGRGRIGTVPFNSFNCKQLLNNLQSLYENSQAKCFNNDPVKKNWIIMFDRQTFFVHITPIPSKSTVS